MNLFQKLGQLFSGFLNNLFGGTIKNNQHHMARGFIEKQKRSQKKLKENMTELIFQRKKFEARLSQLENEKLNMKNDLEVAALQDKDELAMTLMEQLENISAEVKQIQINLQLVRNEIQTAKNVEIELSQQIEKSESQLAVLASRMESVKMRENLQGHFSKLNKEINGLKPGFSQIEENIMHLEAKLEGLHGDQASWKTEVKKMRKERSQYSRKGKLNQLKEQLKLRQLPGRVLEPVVEIVH